MADRSGDGDGPATGPPPADDTVVRDPRMRQRREEVSGERTRRRRRRYLWVVLPVLVAVLFVGLAWTPLLAVEEMRVEGAERTGEEEILEATGFDPGIPLLTLDEGGAEQRIRELPWVDTADVIREWPRTVRVVVNERTPVAVATSEESNLVVWVDATGRVLRLGGEVPEDMIVVTGLAEVAEEGERVAPAARAAVEIAARAPDRVPGVLDEVGVDLDAVIRGDAPGAGATVRFRNGDAVDEKLVALDTLLNGADLTCLETIDLWVPDTPTLTRDAGCQEAAE